MNLCIVLTVPISRWYYLNNVTILNESLYCSDCPNIQVVLSEQCNHFELIFVLFWLSQYPGGTIWTMNLCIVLTVPISRWYYLNSVTILNESLYCSDCPNIQVVLSEQCNHFEWIFVLVWLSQYPGGTIWTVNLCIGLTVPISRWYYLNSDSLSCSDCPHIQVVLSEQWLFVLFWLSPYPGGTIWTVTLCIVLTVPISRWYYLNSESLYCSDCPHIQVVLSEQWVFVLFWLSPYPGGTIWTVSLCIVLTVPISRWYYLNSESLYCSDCPHIQVVLSEQWVFVLFWLSPYPGGTIWTVTLCIVLTVPISRWYYLNSESLYWSDCPHIQVVLSEHWVFVLVCIIMS